MDEGQDRVRLETRPHGAALARPLARSVALAAAGGGLVVLGSPVAWPLGVLGAVALVVAAASALRAVLAWDRTRLIVTREELVVVYGLVRRRVASVDVRGAAIEVEQTLLGRLLGYATVVAGDLEVPYVPDARRLARSI